MSYCRWSECDVYAYDSCEGGVRFWVAGDDSFNRLCGTYNEAHRYAKELRDKHGFDVPSHAIDALREDAIDEAKRYFGPDSAVAELVSDNANLRDELDRMTEAVEALHSAPLEDQLVQALNVADKLRELAQRMWRLERFGCYGCRQECDAESCYANECKEAIEIEQEMRELGVEQWASS